jgi:hypothetical protein
VLPDKCVVDILIRHNEPVRAILFFARTEQIEALFLEVLDTGRIGKSE